jgi:magnesium transporter
VAKATVGRGKATMFKCFQINEGKIVDCPQGSGNVMLYVNPDEAQRRYLIEELKIDEHTLQSALDPDEISRLEFEPEHVALIFKRPKNYSAEDQYMFKVSSMGLFWFRERVVLLLPEDFVLFEGKHFQKLSSINDLVLKLLYRIVGHYLGHLRTINLIYDSLEQKINKAMENRYLINLFSLEKGMVYYQNAIHSNQVVIEKIKNNAARIGLSPENLEFLDDLIVENNQCYKQAEIYSNIFASLMDARVSVVNNNLNVLIKLLNIITIAIMVPTFVVSAFSMNVKIPLATHPMAFWFIMGMAGVSLAAFMLVWRVARK